MSAPGTRDDAAASVTTPAVTPPAVTTPAVTEAAAAESALPTAAYERARAISRAGGASGELTGPRLAAHGLCWDDVAHAAALQRGEHDAHIAAYEALDPTEREYQDDREQWVALQCAAAAEQPGAWERTRTALGLRPEQSPSRLQLAALETQRMRELEAEYDRTMGRTPVRYERPYTELDAEADDGSEAAWWAIDGMDAQRTELGEPSVAERISAARAAAHGEVLYGLGDHGLTGDDLERHQATERANGLAYRLGDLSVHEVMDLAQHGQNVRHVAEPGPDGDADTAVARAQLTALQIEADRRAAGQPEYSSAALLSEYVDRCRIDLDPAVDRERFILAGALHRALEDETRVARQEAAWAQLPEPGDDAGWAALDDSDDPAVWALLEDAADPVADAARDVATTGRALGVDSEEARDARADYEDTHARYVRPDLEEPRRRAAAERFAAAAACDERAITSGPIPPPRSGEARSGEAPIDRAERAELAAREADPWGHEDCVLAEHLADEAALGGPQLPDPQLPDPERPDREPTEIEEAEA